MLKPEIEEDFRLWVRDAVRRRGLKPHEVAWQFPFQIHPRTVEDWLYGRRRPRYPELVGLCTVLQELPPVLRSIGLDAPDRT